MSKKTQLPMSYILVTLLLAQLFHFSLADVGTAAAYSPPYTLMLGLLWGVSGALEMRDLDSDGSGAQLWLACIVGRFRVWLTSILACRLNRRRRGLGHSSLLKWVPFGTLIANVSATCVMAAFATLMKVEGFTALIEMMVSKFGRDGASFTRGRAATKKLIKGFAHWWNREKKNKPKEKRSGRDGQATSDHNHGVVDSASLSTTSTHGNHVQFCYSIWAIACILLYPATAEAVPDSSYNQDAAIKLAYGVDLGSQLATPPPLPPVQPPSPPPIDGSPIPPSSAPPQSKPKFRRPPPPPPLRNEPAQKPGAVNLVLVLGVAIPVGALVIVAVVIVVVVVVKMQTPASTTTTIHDPIPTSQPTEINLHEITTSTNPTETTTTPTEFVAATNIVGGSGSNTLDEGEAEVQMYPVVPSTPVARPKIKGKRMVMN